MLQGKKTQKICLGSLGFINILYSFVSKCFYTETFFLSFFVLEPQVRIMTTSD